MTEIYIWGKSRQYHNCKFKKRKALAMWKCSVSSIFCMNIHTTKIILPKTTILKVLCNISYKELFPDFKTCIHKTVPKIFIQYDNTITIFSGNIGQCSI